MVRFIKDIICKLELNLFDVNFILIFVGFSFFSSFSSLSSVLYRAVALGVALLCMVKKRRYETIVKGKYYKFFIFLLLLFMIRSLPDFFIGEYSSSYYTGSRNLALMFGFGVMLIPMLVSIKGINELNHNSDLCIMLILLVFMLNTAISGSAVENANGRIALNERQSTLTFGDNGAYLAVLGSCLLTKLKSLNLNRHSKMFSIILIISMIIGILSALKSGSRGPVLSMLSGLFFVFSTVGVKKNIILFVLGCCLLFAFNLDEFIESYAPTFFNRMNNTLEDGDLSGRDEIFSLAIQKILDSPIIGNFPLIMGKEASVGYHNYYLTIGVGLGVLGFLGIIAFVIMLLYKSYKNRFHIETPFQLFVIAMLWVVAVRGISGINPFTNAIANTTIAYASIILWDFDLNRRKKI